MKTIAIMNNKGGVGKTVTAINLADILTRECGKRVVLADCDGQYNLTRFYLPCVDETPQESLTTMADLLMGACEQVWSDNLVPLRDGLALIPGSSELYELDRAAVMNGLSFPERLREVVQAARDDGETDYFIFDCPPGYTVASIGALLACDEVVIPMLVDGFSFAGVQDMRTQIASLRMARHNIQIAGALITQWHNSDVVRQGEALLRRCGVPVFRQVIRRTDKMSESTFERLPVAQHSPTSAAARDYRAWVREYLGEELGDGQV